MGLQPTSDSTSHATSNERTRRAKTGLARPVPAPTTTNDRHSSSGDEGGRHNNEGVAGRKYRIHWSSTLDVDLARCNEGITLPRGGGRQKELFRLWHELHPELPATVNALTHCLSRIRKLGSVLAPSIGSVTMSPGSEVARQLGSVSPLSSEWLTVSPGSGIVHQSGDVLAHLPGGLSLSPGLDTAEVRGEDTDESRWNHRTRAATVSGASAPGESTSRPVTCRPGRPRKSRQLVLRQEVNWMGDIVLRERLLGLRSIAPLTNSARSFSQCRFVRRET